MLREWLSKNTVTRREDVDTHSRDAVVARAAMFQRANESFAAKDVSSMTLTGVKAVVASMSAAVIAASGMMLLPLLLPRQL